VHSQAARAQVTAARNRLPDHILSQASGLRGTIVEGSAGVLALSEDQFQEDKQLFYRRLFSG
jgi:hypothetical protein